MCRIDIISTLLNHEFKYNNYETTRHSICTYVFLLSLTTWRSQRATRTLLKKSKNFKKFRILEFKTRNTMSRNDQDKKNEISYFENQDKTRNEISLRQEILSWWNTSIKFFDKYFEFRMQECSHRFAPRMGKTYRVTFQLANNIWRVPESSSVLPMLLCARTRSYIWQGPVTTGPTINGPTRPFPQVA